ncbi:MAG: hypothetical protein VX409_04325 [Verrucomicrobiota bacterium]|nr:hypothetical protein [Verrucomicrobiota bacterium]
MNIFKIPHYLFCQIAILVLAQFAYADKPIAFGESGTQRQLFVDRHLINEMSAELIQYVHRPNPKEVVLTTDAPWEGNTSAYYSIFRDDGLFRMYYRGSHWDTSDKRETHREVTCYAESRDGVHWVKPKLGLFKFNGSSENNIVLDGLGTHCFVAFKDQNPNASPELLYKGISRGMPIGEKGLYVYGSRDGLNWKLMHESPVILDGYFDSQNLAFWDSYIGKYREYHRTFVDGIRAIMTSTSNDYIHWSKPELLAYQNGLPVQHLYTNAVLSYSRAPQLLIGFPSRYLPSDGQRVEPTFMSSRDGVRFHRWLDAVVPESAPKDRQGNRSNYMAWGLVEIPGRPNHLSVYATEAYYTGPDSRLRRFEYRKDGFVSIRAGDESGEMVTKPFALGRLAERLTVNFQTKKEGFIRIAIEQPNGQPIAGYEISSCNILLGDSLRGQVTWFVGNDISHLQKKYPIVRLRFKLRKADLYSFQFQPFTK